jgi:hypothetical protein
VQEVQFMITQIMTWIYFIWHVVNEQACLKAIEEEEF